MKEIKNDEGQTIGVQISIFDLMGDGKHAKHEESKLDEKKKTIEVKVELDEKPVKEAVEDLMNVIVKHNLLTSCDDEGNLIVHLGDLITDNIVIK